MLLELHRRMEARRRYYQKVFTFDEDLYPVINMSSLLFIVLVFLSSLPFLNHTIMDCRLNRLNNTTFIIHNGGILIMYSILSRWKVWMKLIRDIHWYKTLVEIDREVATMISQLTVEDFLGETNDQELLRSIVNRQQEMIYFIKYYSFWLAGSNHERLLKDLYSWKSLYSKYSI